MAHLSQGILFKWFKELVKHKMSAIAIPVAGISVSVTVLMFSKLFDGVLGNVIAWAGLALLLFMLLLFALSATVLVMRNLREQPDTPLKRNADGRFMPRQQRQPIPTVPLPAIPAEPAPQAPVPSPRQE